MNLKSRRFIFFSALCFACVLAVFFALKFKKTSEVESSPSAPSYTMNHVRSFRFTQKGELESQLTAKKLVYSSKYRTTSFAQPSIQFYPNQQIKDPWTLHAQQGVLTHETKKLKFVDNVILISPRNQTEASELLTDSMTLDYHQMTANSNAPVVIKNHNLFLSGKGFHAKLKEAYIQILSEIQGNYQVD